MHGEFGNKMGILKAALKGEHPRNLDTFHVCKIRQKINI
jgi:hypothetical protein